VLEEFVEVPLGYTAVAAEDLQQERRRNQLVGPNLAKGEISAR